MARPQKDGLDYFSIDVNIYDDDKIQYLEAECGVLGFGILIKIFCKIYGGHGYYALMTQREQKLFSKRINVDINLINDVINCSINEEIFDKKVFDAYGVLTSAGIQKRYIGACERRKAIYLEKNYILTQIPEDIRSKVMLTENALSINVDINSINVDINSINTDIGTQRREEKSKEEKSKTKAKEINECFEKLWSLYPNKKGKAKVKDSQKKILYELGVDVVSKCIERYKSDKKEWTEWQHGNTFFYGGYVDYLDENYKHQEKQSLYREDS